MASLSADELDARSAWLSSAYDPQSFVQEAHAVTELIRSHLVRASSRERAVFPGTPPDRQLECWPDPESSPRANARELMADIINGSTCQHHPGFVGQQLSVPPPIVGPVAMLSAILNNSSAIYEGAPIAIALERRVVSWMARKIGYSSSAGGVLTSGGTLGALTALLAMRQAKASSNAWVEGLASGERFAVLVSEEAHYCNRRACAILGLGESAAIPVGTDASFKMDLHALRARYDQAVEEGVRAIAVVANAGSTSTGSHDDLLAIAEFCRERALWLHVDAAHGGSALLTQKYSAPLRGIERADSVVWDAHKMMQMPSLCTAVLVRDARHLDQAFRQDAAYLLSTDGLPWYHPAARNFETTKPSMVFPLYVTLRTLGADFLAACIEYAYDLAQAFAEEIEQRDDFELLVRPESNIVCFRRRAPSEESDALQLGLQEAVNRAGRFFIMRTSLRGAAWLRVVLMNPFTRLDDLRELLDDLLALNIPSDSQAHMA